MRCAIYEEDSSGSRAGDRPKRSQRDALDACRNHQHQVLAGFFDVSHEWLIRFLNHRIGDRCIIRLIQKRLKVGVLEEWVVTIGEQRSGQDSVVSPSSTSGRSAGEGARPWGGLIIVRCR